MDLEHQGLIYDSYMDAFKAVLCCDSVILFKFNNNSFVFYPSHGISLKSTPDEKWQMCFKFFLISLCCFKCCDCYKMRTQNFRYILLIELEL